MELYIQTHEGIRKTLSNVCDKVVTDVDKPNKVYVLFPNKTSIPVVLNDVMIIARGNGHAIAVLTNGSVMTIGDNSKGQCGTGNNFSHYDMWKDTGIKAFDIASGANHSAAISPDGHLVVTGDNTHGQLGIPLSTKNTKVWYATGVYAKSVTCEKLVTQAILNDGKILRSHSVSNTPNGATWYYA